MLHFLPKENDYWIGLKIAKKTQNWHWTNDSRSIEDSNEIWLDGEPKDPQNERCAVLSNSNLVIARAKSVHCNNGTNYYGICERPV